MREISATRETRELLELIEQRRDALMALFARYGATNPRLFGSVASGTANAESDIDILVEMDPEDGNILMRASGLLEEARALFGHIGIDVFPVQLLNEPVSRSAITSAVSL